MDYVAPRPTHGNPKGPDIDFPGLMPLVVERLLGDPNRACSTKTEWRYGARGSLSIDLRKGVFCDHESGTGGGVLDLIEREKGLRGVAAIEWLQEQRLIDAPKPSRNGEHYFEDDPGPQAEPTPEEPRVVATYDYQDETGKILRQVVRYQPKAFSQRKPDGNGGWIGKTSDVQEVPYRLPELLARPEGAIVFILEGEKDVDRVASLGLIATCNAGGAGKWPSALNAHFAGATVVILPDNDDPGRRHAAMVARELHPIGASVKILNLPGLGHKEDVSNWLERGGTVDELTRLVRAVPEWAEAPDDVEPIRSPAMIRDAFPAPMAPAAYQGVIGAIVNAIAPETEADPAALLAMLIPAIGAVIGRTAHARISGSLHHANFFAVVVGETAKSRKSTAWALVRQIIEAAEPAFAARIVGGLASGEALIAMVRDGNDAEDDPGVADKRLLVCEDEFARVLRVARRDGSILPDVLRPAWDGQTLANRTKKFPMVATRPHISLVGAITQDEVGRLVSEVDAGNGLGNRFLWVAARRSKSLPFGGSPIDVDGLGKRLGGCILLAQRNLEYRFADDAAEEWRRVYPSLSEGKPGLLGAMTGRAEAQVWRLSMLFAALDGCLLIAPQHLHAALAVWDYCERSARWIFGARLGDPVADDIVEALHDAGEQGLTRNQIRDAFGRHKPAAVIARSLALLLERGMISCRKEASGGRPREVWTLRGKGGRREKHEFKGLA